MHYPMNKLRVLSTVFALTGAAIAQQPAAATASPRASDSALDSAHALVQQAFATPSVSRRIALLEQAIAVLPDADEPHFLISVELQAIGKYEEAEQELVQCLAINADHYLAEFNLGQIRWKQGRTQDAVALLEEAEQDAVRRPAPAAMLGAIRGRRDVIKTILAQRDRAQERVTQHAAPVLEMQVKRVGDQPVEDGRQSQQVLASREIGRQVAAMLASIPADARDARMFAEAVVIAAGSVEPALDQASQFAGVALVLDAQDPGRVRRGRDDADRDRRRRERRSLGTRLCLARPGGAEEGGCARESEGGP